MSNSSLGNPFDAETRLTHGSRCGCDRCGEHRETPSAESQAELADPGTGGEGFTSSDDLMDRVVESAVVRGVFGHSDTSRRNFIRLVGGGTLAAALSAVVPMDKVKAAVKDSMGPLEKTKLKVGFVPITCATPIIMAQPMGFYAKHGLDVDVIKTAGWAVARDKSLNGEYDASHMLTPMPLAMTMGAGSTATPYIMPAVENINGQAIVLHNKHKDKRDPKDWKGFKGDR